MTFSSLTFLFIFLPLVMTAYFITPKQHRNLVLFIANLVFYAWAEPLFVLLLLAILVLDYSAGLYLDKNREQKRLIRVVFWGTAVLNALLLIVFKYRLLAPHEGQDTLATAFLIPLGISIYVFQGLSYVIDLYLQRTKVQKSFINLGVYIAFFPQMICGPILRYGDVRSELKNREVTATKISNGYGMFIRGLAKKIFIADQLLNLWNSVKSLSDADISVLTAWLGILSFGLAVYFYFSGYSEMARGIAKILGFEIPANFNYPYISKNVAEFSRRWNISLTTWFKTYVFTPIAPNSNSVILTIFKLLGIWILIGMWYGGTINFVLWGFYLGVFILLERLFFVDWLNRIPVFFQRLYTAIILLLGWVIFEFDSLSQITRFYRVLFSGTFIDSTTIYYLGAYLPALILGIFCASNLWHNFALRQEQGSPRLTRWGRILFETVLTLLCVVYLVAGQVSVPEFFIRF